MPLSPVPVESFGGLNLSDDPGEIGWGGAVDVLNVEFAPGRIRSRPGYTRFDATTNTYKRVSSYPQSNALIAIRTDGTLDSLDGSSAAVLATSVPGGANYAERSTQLYGTSSTPFVYIAGGTQAMEKYPVAGAFATEAAAPKSHLVGLMPADNRLVAAHITTPANISRVQFSEPGDPTTWGANNWVDLRPNVGLSAAQPYAGITALANYRSDLFVFKPDSIFVFYGNSTDSSGNPIFNYRAIENAGTGGCVSFGAVAAAPRGVYFVAKDGIYLTSGETPVKVSKALDPIFRGEGALASLFTLGGEFDSTARGSAPDGLYWWRDRLFYSRDNDSNTARYVFVYDENTGTWSLWNAPFGAGITGHATSSGIYDQDAPFFPIASGQGIGKMDFATRASTDNGTAITSRYRSGFSDLGSPDMKRIHSWRLQGSGSPTLQVSTDFGSLETGAAVQLGTAPAIAEGVRRYSPRGRQFSWQVGGTSPWSLNNFSANVAGKRKSGEHVPA